MDPEVAVQLLSPSESVKYCARLDEPYYPKAFSKLMLKSTVDTLCDLYKSRRYGFDILSSAFGNLADHIHGAKQVAEDLSYDVGAFKDCDDEVFNYDEFAKELYERDKSCKDIRSALAALFIDSEGDSYRAGREFETDTQYYGWRHNTWPISFETDMNGITVQVPLSSYFDAHFKNKYSYDKDDYALRG